MSMSIVPGGYTQGIVQRETFYIIRKHVVVEVSQNGNCCITRLYIKGLRHGGLPAKGKEVFVYTSGLEIECTQMIDFFQFVVKSHSKLVSVNFLKQC